MVQNINQTFRTKVSIFSSLSSLFTGIMIIQLISTVKFQYVIYFKLATMLTILGNIQDLITL